MSIVNLTDMMKSRFCLVAISILLYVVHTCIVHGIPEYLFVMARMSVVLAQKNLHAGGFLVVLASLVRVQYRFATCPGGHKTV